MIYLYYESNRLNNFAISSKGIGDALQRSASALNEAGNTIDESIALVTAANSVIQNPEQVGTALKTLALRLRGTKTELEEAGEDTDGMAESVSQLQAKLKALTHGKVDIMANADEFKNTTQILREMSGVWSEMTDIERASALELMGGKRQANILASIISNFQTVEDVIKTSSNSSGSALAENEKYLDSIQGKIDVFTNELQTFWMKTIESDMVKGVVSLGTSILKLVNDIGLLPIALSGVLVYFTAIKKNNPLTLFQNLGTIVKDLGSKIASFSASKVLSWDSGAIEIYARSVSKLTAVEQAERLTKQGLEKDQIREVLIRNQVEESVADEILSRTALKTATMKEILTKELGIDACQKQAVAEFLAANGSKKLTAELLDQAVAQEIIKKEQAAGILANYQLAFSWKALGTSIKTAFMSNPVGWIMTIATALLSLTPIIEGLFKSSEEKLQELESEWQELEDKITSATSSFKDLKTSADEVIPRFAELAEGVDQFGKNISLTDSEYEEFLSLNNKIAEMFPEINTGMDSNGNAMLNLSFTAGTLEESLWDLVEAQRVAANQEIADTMPDVLDNIDKTVKNYKKGIKDVEKSQKELEDAYAIFEKGGTYTFSQIGDVKNNKTIKMFDKLGLDYDITVDNTGAIGSDASPSITYKVDFKTDTETARRNYENAMAGFSKEIENINEKVAQRWQQLNPIVSAWAQTDYTYQGLSDEMQNIANAMIGNLDFDNLGLDTAEEVENYITKNILNKIDAMAPSAQDKFASLFTIDTSDLSAQEYIDKIKSISNELEDMDIGWSAQEILDNTGFQDIIEGYEDTVDNIAKILGEDFNNDPVEMAILKNNLYSLDADQLTNAFDIVKKYGIKTWDELETALENKTFDISLDIDVESEGIEKVTTAFEESTSAAGLSAESIDNIKSRYRDLEEYDPSTLFEETANGIHLNTKAARELEQAYKDQKTEELNKNLDGLVDKYNSLTDEIKDCTDAEERASLYVQRQNILDQINDVAMMASQYTGLTSAYNKWQDAQNAGSARDMYSSIISSKEEIEDELSRGWVDEGTRAYIELLSGQDLSTAPIEEVRAAYEELNQTISNTGYSVFDFFTVDDNGKETVDGVYNFFDTVMAKQKELGKEWVKIGEDGNLVFDFGVDGDQAVADALGISEELVQIILKAAEDAGFEVNFKTAYSALADLRDDADSAINKLKELGATDYDFKINSTDINDLTKQIEEAKKAKERLTNGELNIDVDASDIENANTLIATLIYQKQSLDKAAILNVDTSKATTDIEVIIQKLQKFKEDYNFLEVQTAIGADTKEADAQIQATIDDLKKQDPEILASLGIDLSKSNEKINTAINDITTDKMVELGLDTSKIENYQALEHNAKGTVVWENNIDKVTKWANKTKEAKGIVTWYNNTEHVKTNFSSSKKKSNKPTKVNGTAHAKGLWGAKENETSLVGELGPELRVRNNTWELIGEHGAEFTDVKRGDIIFNHKQTKNLLENGYITSRGTAYAKGINNPFSWIGGILSTVKKKKKKKSVTKAVTKAAKTAVKSSTIGSSGSGPVRSATNAARSISSASSSLSSAASDVSDAASEFKEVFDWIEVRLEEINEKLDLKEAQLENATNSLSKNNIIDSMMSINESKIANLTAGVKKYSEYAAKLLAEVPAQYRAAAQDGSIAITEFAGEADEKTVEAINNYREWAKKVANLNQQLEETKTTLRELAIRKIDNAENTGNVKATVENSQTEKLQNAVDYDEERGLVTSEAYYLAMMENSNKKIEYLTTARNEMQKAFNDAVKSGKLIKGSDDWYEQLDRLYQIDAEIDEATIELEQFQNAINDIYWDNFENLTKQIEYLKDQTQSLIDLMENSGDLINTPEGRTYAGGTIKYWTADEVKWTKEGLTSLGLYAQQMEIAEFEARQYAEAIDDLNKDYQAGLYSESEYMDKLDELTSSQYDAIDSYYEAQDAIVDLNKTRIDSIKNGIEKEIDAYEELIDKKKEELDAEKDLYDFQKSISEQQKDIADIQRKLAALSTDNSASAMAKRKQLEAELAEARANLEESYYDRSVSDRQDALDKELDDFQTSKNLEIEKWEEYLDNIEKVIADSLGVVQANTSDIYDTLSEKAQEYDLTLSDAIMSPWQDGALAVWDYQEQFDTSMSFTMDQLEAMKNKWQEVIDKMVEAGNVNVANINRENANYASASKTSTTTSTPSKTQTQTKTIAAGGKINAGSARIYGSPGGQGYTQYYAKDPIYQVLEVSGNWVRVRHHKLSSGTTGWFKKSDVKAYAKGTKKLNESGIVNIDELGEELIIGAKNGRLAYMEKGSGVVPADLTSNLMDWGALNPQDWLDRNRPSVGIPTEIHNTEINLNIEYGDMVSIGEFHGDNPEDIAKIVAKQFEKHTQQLNNSLRKFVR